MEYLTLRDAAAREGKSPDDLLRRAAAGRLELFAEVIGPAFCHNTYNQLTRSLEDLRSFVLTVRRITESFDHSEVHVDGLYHLLPNDAHKLLTAEQVQPSVMTSGTHFIRPYRPISRDDLLVREADVKDKPSNQPHDRLGAVLLDAFEHFTETKGREPQWRELLPYLERSETVKDIDHEEEEILWERADGGLKPTSFKSIQNRLTKIRRSRPRPE